MHVQSCLHPVRIIDQYTKEPLYVPCGRCEACLSKRAHNLVTRLEAEKACWKHAFFFTLTYDADHLPLLKVVSNDGFLVDVSPKRVHPILGSMLVNRFDGYKKLGVSDIAIQISEEYVKRMQDLHGGVPYCSSLDIQRFVKRLRVRIERDYKKMNVKNGYDEKQVPKIRYFICAELGPTTLRPHCHGILFFNSDWLNENIHQYISSCWQFGIVDSSYVWGKAINYVAKYCNCSSHLPALYKITSLRPFALYSKHPALGTLQVNSVVQKELFESKSLYQKLPQDGREIVSPLLRALQDKLYPRLTAFDKFSLADLYTLYRVPSQFESFERFRKTIRNNRSTVINSYLSLLQVTKGEIDNKLYRWFSISHRVVCQADVWNISIKHYVDTIFDYYKLLDYANLKNWYEFSEEYTKEHDVADLFTYDNMFAKHLLSLACSVNELDCTEIMYLLSFGIDLDKWFDLDDYQRASYRARYSLEKSEEYLQFKAESLFYYEASSKTKRKNDYLESHPDLFKVFNDLKF